MSSEQSRMTDTQHGKPDKKDRKSIKHNRLADEHSNIAAANAQGGELTSNEQGGNTDEHEGITGTIPNTQSGHNGLANIQDGMTSEQRGTTTQDGVTAKQNVVKINSEVSAANSNCS